MTVLDGVRPDRTAEVVAAVAGAEFRTQWDAYRTIVPLDPAASSVTAAVAAIEELGAAGAAPGVCYAMTSQLFGLAHPLRTMLGPERHGLIDGSRVLCHALTEEGGGSDPLSMTTRAEPGPDGTWRLSGRKAFVTAAPVAQTALVFARTAAERTPFSLTAFLVDLAAPGVYRDATFPKTALVEVPMGVLDLDGVVVRPEDVVGGEGSGLAVLTTTTVWERGLLLAYALGPMRRVLDATVAWAREREQFGRRMGTSALVAGRIADMALALHRSQVLVRGMAARFEAGESARGLADAAALTKLSVSQDHLAFAEQAAALGGVRSFVEDTGLTADLLGPAAGLVYAGPNDLLRVSVARGLGLPVEN
ncbi:acyl-CoA dehydrogenase family protein [Pseudonocardia sp. HH130630-07]|uniref:acyl-CoA dehydrogenase family protein n=1 Tax=Pseudonocardia sp. HH130630-07 TaxID=1690815 RepID=UPI000815093F|nr:acyl-CoA dehydrogenase [Pseudonocardia sp. HH130630-07]ANY07731.1 isovaleryl-CoA dehydrogenase [Pseudonocardia sp. HH130630-07]